jgi:pseudaminic acid synthase
MNPTIQINGRCIGTGHPCYIVAEMSANHNQCFDDAVKIIEAAKAAGADAIKLQTYTPDTMTIDCRNPYFQIGKGSAWEGRHLYDLYDEAYTPWEWQPKLKEIADKINIDLFSTPFDLTAVDFLQKMEVPAHKIASFEIVDLPLIHRIAATGKPIILSTGMATLAEIEEAVGVIRATGNDQLALLKCTSAYPAPPEEMNLLTIPHLSRAFGVPVGLSDHTLGTAVPLAGVALGACIVEKHFTLSRSAPGPDNAFSLDPDEFKAMVEAVGIAEKSLGSVHYGAREHESQSLIFRRSLFVVQDMKSGEIFTAANIRSIRPGHGLHPRYLENVIGRHAARDIKRGTPLTWELIGTPAEFGAS